MSFSASATQLTRRNPADYFYSAAEHRSRGALWPIFAPARRDYPVMLGMPAPKLLAYPIETVIAEKFEAMVKLGIANSRMKDFHDVRTFLRDFRFEGPILGDAVANTFRRRQTPLPADGREPLAFTEEFFGDESKRRQWNAFRTKYRMYVAPEELEQVVMAINQFLMPIVVAITSGKEFRTVWNPGGPWKTEGRA
jgi:Nucleotidyl transferase AbiEii toxin, Type IV TA system